MLFTKFFLTITKKMSVISDWFHLKRFERCLTLFNETTDDRTTHINRN
jgi:hypothetical protein